MALVTLTVIVQVPCPSVNCPPLRLIIFVEDAAVTTPRPQVVPATEGLATKTLAGKVSVNAKAD